MTSFNRLTVRKEIGAIRYRLAEKGLSDTLRRQIISRHLDNIADTVPVEYLHIVTKCKTNLYNNPEQFIINLDLLEGLVPATYGSIPAGIVFRHQMNQYTKRKTGAEYLGVVYPHLDADAPVTIINE